VRLLPVGLGSDEHVDPELEPRRLEDDFVTAVPRGEALGYVRDVEGVPGRSRHR
jgi:hypothetical protein